MSDIQLLTFGCIVTFIAAAGAYVALREGFLQDFSRETMNDHPQQTSSAQPVEDAA